MSEKTKSISVLRVILVRLRFLFVFVAIGAIVANWDRIMSLTDRWMRPAKTAEIAASSDTEWYCPMHPSVVRNESAKCPTCGMQLSQRKRGTKEALPEGVLSRLRLSPYRIRQAGAATEAIEYRPLVREVSAAGFIEYDERRITDLSTRIAGRVDELFVSFKGARIKAGDPLYKIYSPDLVTTQEEYLLAMKTLDEIAAQPQHDREARSRASRLAEAARVRLRLWGITDAQVADIEKSRKAEAHLTIYSPVSGVVYKKEIHAGHYVQVGEDPFTIADDSVVWMQAEIFERDIGQVVPGIGVELQSEAYPGESFHGTVSYIHPELDSTTRTVKARVEVDNKDLKLKPGMYVNAAFRIPIGKMEELPESEAPGAEPKTGDGVETGAPPAERTVYVCEMHRDLVFDKPGKCERCGEMQLEPVKIPMGSRLVYTCPDHPEITQDKPGKCPKDGKPLEFKIVAERTQTIVEWACPLHPNHTSPTKAICPETGSEMKLFRRENALAVPLSAVIDAGSKKTVFIERSSGIFDAVEVVLGPRAGEYFQILNGLKAGDRVVSAGAFLLDAEARLKPGAGASYFGASGHEAHR